MSARVSSANTFHTIERAANLAGVSHQALRNWLDDDNLPKDARPTYTLNGKTIIFSLRQVAALRRFVESR